MKKKITQLHSTSNYDITAFPILASKGLLGFCIFMIHLCYLYRNVLHFFFISFNILFLMTNHDFLIVEDNISGLCMK